MKKLTGLLLMLILCYSTFAQNDSLNIPKKDSLKKQAIDIYHGINTGTSINTYLYYYENGDGTSANRLPALPMLGYFLDIHMRGRTWLFMQFNASWFKDQYSSTFSGNTYTYKSNHFDLNVPIRFGFRLGKEDAKFSLYPTAGFGVYIPLVYFESTEKNGVNVYKSRAVWLNSDDGVPFYPLLNIGFEAKWRFCRRHNLAFGFNSNYIFAENSFYLKFGWNKYKKEKAN